MYRVDERKNTEKKNGKIKRICEEESIKKAQLISFHFTKVHQKVWKKIVQFEKWNSETFIFDLCKFEWNSINLRSKNEIIQKF